MRSILKYTLLAAAVLAAPLLVSCASAEEEMIQFTPGGVPYVLEMQDYGVRSGLSVIAVDSTMEGDLPMAVVELRNATASELRFRAGFVWADADGRVLASPGSAPRTIHLMPGASTTLQSAATAPAAYRFKLQLRSEN
ncbi:MAG: DUF1425 domain-containing protein [Planctomycetes bacterium]|nr:DUF1425 domain-containing protein [Planctomycetota bacterium]MBL7008150.1 DUF1425 domain-containing protein [Planctomycetota bacterium]